MENSGLRLVKAPPVAGPPAATKAAVLAIGLTLSAAAAAATLGGADRARRGFDPQSVAVSALEISLERSSRSAEARSKLAQLRTMVARRPLDARTRAVYASLLLSLSSGLGQLRAPAFHAAVAARLSPVTVPVVELAALVLAHAGEPGEALVLVRHMFDYDAEAAAGLLARMEPLLDRERLATAIPDAPAAWLAWYRELRERDRPEEATAILEEAHIRWPGNLAVVERLAAAVARRGDWDALRALFPDRSELPGLAGSAGVTAYRAMARAASGDREGALEDIRAALRLDGRSVPVQSLAGDAHALLGDWSDARRLWRAALFATGTGNELRRLSLLLRLARLEQEHGEPAAALRLWRSVQEIEPDHEEARRRIAELTGAGR